MTDTTEKQLYERNKQVLHQMQNIENGFSQSYSFLPKYDIRYDFKTCTVKIRYR